MMMDKTLDPRMPPDITDDVFKPVIEIKPLRMSSEIDKIAGALAKAQGVMKHPKKNKTAVVPLKTGGSYSYDYTDLADVLDALRGPFSDNGIAMVQVPYVDRMTFDSTCIGVVTLLMHESGQWIEGSLSMPVTDAKPQSIGSIITYLRRYMAGPMGGIASDVDDDGSAAEGNSGQSRERQQTQAKSTPAPAVKKEASVVVFDGETPTLKAELFSIAKKLGINKVEDLKRLNQSCKGLEMAHLEAATKEWRQDNMPKT